MRVQLGKHRKIRSGLALATCSLLGLPAKEIKADNHNWDISTSAFYYGEADGRVSDFSVKAIASRELDEDNSITLNTQVDTLSGASPNGAIPADSIQTFSRPSGSGRYTIEALETPLDDTFRDTRLALGASYNRQLTRLLSGSVGASASKEYDYLHLGLNGSLNRESEDRNTAISIGIAINNDSFSPVGDAPVPLSAMSLDDTSNRNPDADTDKTVSSLLLGVSQVLNRRAIAQINYSFSSVEGYLNDPYKILSVVDADTGILLSSSQEEIGLYLYEKRPDSRNSHSVFAKLKYHLTRDIVDLSYRFHTDDWEIDSHTVDFRYRYNFGETQYLEPHIRYYKQSAAEFHRYFLSNTDLPDFASADYRLAEFSATTLGLKWGKTLDENSTLSARVEYYQANGDDHPDVAFGQLKDKDLYPEVNAWITQISCNLKL